MPVSPTPPEKLATANANLDFLAATAIRMAPITYRVSREASYIVRTISTPRYGFATIHPIRRAYDLDYTDRRRQITPPYNYRFRRSRRSPIDQRVGNGMRSRNEHAARSRLPWC